MKRLAKIFFILLALVTVLTVVAVASSENETTPDAMTDILADAYLDGKIIETSHLASDGYLGIPVDFTMYYDAENFDVDHNTNGTKLIMYVVNTHAERTGTDSDVSIITSMVKKGYLVAVADYHNHKKAVSPDLEWSTQKVMRSLLAGSYFKNAEIKGSYKETFIVPSGHNISTDLVFWQFDRHSVDGTLEKIVEVWNLDFRGMKGTAIIPWHNDGTRKATQNGMDGSEPVWYSKGTGTGAVTYNGESFVPDENGLYIRVKHTLAQEITDCVNKDGSPIDLNLYMHIIYPTNPEKTVPVLTLASSSEHLASGSVSDGRPHTYGFAFNGYAIAMYDYAYVPMARVDHYSYFDGSSMDSGSVTGDNMTYSLFTYNSAYVPTAAMRYLRYLSLTDAETYAFNGKIGVIGNSKGSMITQLADLDLGLVKSLEDGYTEEELEQFAYKHIASFGNYYYLYGHHGETRYDEGLATYTKNGITINGGELQPWLTYEGKMIPSGAQFVYSSCGGLTAVVDNNFAPFMTSAHIGIESNGYASNNHLLNAARNHDVPFLGFELFLGHTFLQRESRDLGIDPYVAYKNFVHYVLDDRAPTVAYTLPLNESEISVDKSFTIHFTGIIPESEIAKVTLTDEDGNATLGIWESAYGRTEWTFTPSTPLRSGMKYTLTVPTTMVAENGKAFTEPFAHTYYTEDGNVTSLGLTETTVSNTNGATVTLTVPDLTAYAQNGVNRAALSVFVSDNAANSLSFYLDNANGTLLDTVPVDGIGHYALDLTNLFSTMNAGEQIRIFIKASKMANFAHPTDSKIITEDFEDGAYTFSKNSKVTGEIVEMAGHGKVFSAHITHQTSSYEPTHKYYSSSASIVQYNNAIPNTLTEADLGRTFTFTFDIYDTVSRGASVLVNNISSKTSGVTDYDSDRLNFNTVAGEWITVSFTFSLQEPLYGKSSLVPKTLSISLSPDGDALSKVYLDNFSLKEVTTDVTLSSASLVLSNAGGHVYKAPVSQEKPFLVGETAYATLAEAVTAIGTASGTITLGSNVTLTDSTVLTGVKAPSLLLDLNGYEIRANLSSTPLIAPSVATNTAITILNGSIYLSGSNSLVGLSKSTTKTDFSLTLNNVHIGTEKNAMIHELLVNTASVGKGGSITLNLNNCTVDMREDSYAKHPVRMVPDPTSSLGITLNMAGGSILMSRTDEKIIFNSMKHVHFNKYEGNYTIFYLASIREFGEFTMLCDDGFALVRENKEIVAPNGYRAYQPFVSEMSTAYGIVPDAYADANDYPFVAFNMDTYAFVGASPNFIQDGGDAIINQINGKSGNFIIYMRRNFTHTTSSFNLGALATNVTVDLGEFTFTYTKGITPQSKYPDTVTTLKFQNGTLQSNTKEAFLTYAPLDNNKENDFHFTFENITFTLTSGVSPSYWVAKAGNANIGGAFVNTITVKDCVFDLTNKTSAISFFGIGHNSGTIDDTLTIIGSNIRGNLTDVMVVTQFGSENRSFSFKPDAKGNYITNTRLTTDPVPDTAIVINGESMLFSKAIATEGDYTTYTVDVDPLGTPYGKIPAEYASDPVTYSMLLFNTSTGMVIWAGNQWGGETANGAVGGILEAMKKNCSKGSLAIYFQNNVTATSAYYNHGATTGVHIIDLNGYTLTAKNTVFHGQAKNKNTTSTFHLTIKNGTIDLGSSQLVSIGSNTYDTIYQAQTTYVFENIDITNISKDTYIVRDSVLGNFITKTDVIFRECDFVFNAGRTIAMFSLGTVDTASNATSASFTVDIQLEGGSITTGDARFPLFLTVNNDMTNKTFSFAEGKNGFTKLIVKKMSAITDNVAHQTNVGTFYFVKTADSNTHSTYSLSAKSVYGYIPSQYANANEHPILVFNVEKGTVVASFTGFGGEGENGGALQYLQKNGSTPLVLYLQADVTATSYYNFGVTQGEHIIDLNGHTVTIAKGNNFMHAQAKNKNALSVTVKNGAFVIGDNNLISVGAGNNSSIDTTGKVIGLTFENVRFEKIGPSGNLVADTVTGLYPVDVNVTFTDCTFDILATKTNFLCNFDTNATHTSLYKVNVVFNGGEFIYAGKNLLPIFIPAENSLKTLVFGKGENGYPTITAPNATDFSTLTYQTEHGLFGAYRISGDPLNSTYRLAPLSFVSAYLNLTNDLNLVYRVFLPYGYTDPVVTFTIGESTVTTNAYTTDENGLCLFRLPNINPARMGETITATLTATIGGETETVTHNTLSVKKYTEMVKAENADNVALSTLIDHLLVYGASAQQYVGQSEDQFVANIGDLPPIPEGKDNLTLTGDASELASITKVGMRLEGALALRITVKASDITGLTLVVTKGGESEVLNFSDATEKNGEYVFLYEGILANELDEEITVTVQKNGENIGKTLTLSANAYLARQDGDASSLTTLVRALYLYGESARAYK